MWCRTSTSTCSAVPIVEQRGPQRQLAAAGRTAVPPRSAASSAGRSASGHLAHGQDGPAAGRVEDHLPGRLPPRVGEDGAQHSRAGRPRRPARPAARRGPARRSAAAPAACCRSRPAPPAGRGTTAAAARTTAAPPRAGSAGTAPSRGPAPDRPAGRPQPADGRRLEQVTTGISASSTARTRVTSRVASSEWPPSSKKSSSHRPAPGRAPRRTAPQTISSRAVRGARPASAARELRRGQRPAVELAVGGERQRVEHDDAAGTMYSGSRAASVRRSAGRVQRARRRRGDHVGDQPRLAGLVLARDHRRPGRPPGCAASAASISPSSIRKPRILTWSSARPRNSSRPSAASAPGRRCGTSAPRRPNGSATKRSAVRPGRPR